MLATFLRNVFFKASLLFLVGGGAFAQEINEGQVEVLNGGTLNSAPAVVTLKQIHGKELDIAKISMYLDFEPRKLIKGVSATKTTRPSCPNVACGGYPFRSSYLAPKYVYKNVRVIAYRKKAPGEWEIAIPLEFLPDRRGDYRLSKVSFVGDNLNGMDVSVVDVRQPGPQCSFHFLGAERSTSPLIQLRYHGNHSYGYFSGTQKVATSEDCSRVVLDPLLDMPDLQPTYEFDQLASSWSGHSHRIDYIFRDMSEDLSKKIVKLPRATSYVDSSRHLKITQLPQEFWLQKRNGWGARSRDATLPVLGARLLFKKNKLIAVEVRSFLLEKDANKHDRDYVSKRSNELWDDSFSSENYRENYYYLGGQLLEKVIHRKDIDFGSDVERTASYLLKDGRVVAYQIIRNYGEKERRLYWFSHHAEADPTYSAPSPQSAVISDLLADQAMWLNVAKQYR